MRHGNGGERGSKRGGCGGQGAVSAGPRCSVVIPVRDMAGYLPEAIESVLAQEGCDWDLAIVDDGSTDGSKDVARRYASERVRVIDEGRLGGPAAARNRGLRDCRGDGVVFLDADDRLLKGSLARLVLPLERDPLLAVAYGEVLSIDALGRPLGAGRPPVFRRRRPSGNVLAALLRGTPIATPGAACIRRSHVEQAGGFRSLPVGEDWELYCRLALRGRFLYLKGPPVLEYRSHPGSLTATRTEVVEHLQPAMDAIFSNADIRARVPSQVLAEQRRRCIAGAHAYAGRLALKHHRWAAARRHLFECLRRDPVRPREAVFFLAALAGWLPGPLRRRIK